MIEIIKADNRHFSDFGWLKTYWLFSFSDYYDPKNIQFGALRVFNDDVVDPGKGFPTHPHEEMEIVTIVLDGEITRQDSMGNKVVMKPGDVQRMSAGTGLTHSELTWQKSRSTSTRSGFFRIPLNLRPPMIRKPMIRLSGKNSLFPVASGQNIPETVTFHTNAHLSM